MNKKKTNLSGNVSSSSSQGTIAYLFRHGAVWFWGNLLAASLFVLLRWVESDQDMPLLLIWYTAVIAISTARLMFGQRFLASRQYADDELDEFGQRFLVSSTLISALWGVSGFVLFSQQVLVQAVHVLLLAGAVIAAMPVLAVSRVALYLQIGIILLPITLNLLLLTDTSHQALAVATMVLTALLVMASRSITHLLQELHAAQVSMQEQANTDPVTQISNRRFFDSIFKTEWRRAARDGNNIALLMIDVDHFKRYNDRHGHHAGDQCLQIIAQCIKSVARRASDVVARHGGEEFAILLPDTSIEDATLLAERLRKNVEEQRIPHSDGAIPRIVTISIGVSCCTPTSPRNIQATPEAELVYPAMLLNAADRALYRAKRNGRNQVAREICGASNITLNLSSQATTHAA
ncbi:MAG: GGDEF domain-containing protein [Gammaproteobacteria bacterium]|nr:GGDEF domain-containing protein [Gammaproteobacteria bacterium]MBU1724324.1 GGDEF domain-containing protein [Gammaproteobacteria bacterium]MBU2006248.1 GGDEF domain-containing protein [Gammaproteobacteria bacterium]